MGGAREVRGQIPNTVHKLGTYEKTLGAKSMEKNKKKQRKDQKTSIKTKKTLTCNLLPNKGTISVLQKNGSVSLIGIV